jgi:catechol 2,3-dioxygenase-like lactoylglutathione lyase family enzyme
VAKCPIPLWWSAPRLVKLSVCIDVPDLSAGTAFYCDALGCSVDKQQASHSTLSAGGVKMQLLLKETGTGATTRTAGETGCIGRIAPSHPA